MKPPPSAIHNIRCIPAHSEFIVEKIGIDIVSEKQYHVTLHFDSQNSYRIKEDYSHGRYFTMDVSPYKVRKIRVSADGNPYFDFAIADNKREIDRVISCWFFSDIDFKDKVGETLNLEREEYPEGSPFYRWAIIDSSMNAPSNPYINRKVATTWASLKVSE